MNTNGNADIGRIYPNQMEDFHFCLTILYFSQQVFNNHKSYISGTFLKQKMFYFPTFTVYFLELIKGHTLFRLP